MSAVKRLFFIADPVRMPMGRGRPVKEKVEEGSSCDVVLDVDVVVRKGEMLKALS